MRRGVLRPRLTALIRLSPAGIAPSQQMASTIGWSPVSGQAHRKPTHGGEPRSTEPGHGLLQLLAALALPFPVEAITLRLFLLDLTNPAGEGSQVDPPL